LTTIPLCEASILLRYDTISLSDKLPTIQGNSAFIFKGVEVIAFYYIPAPGCFDLNVMGSFRAWLWDKSKIVPRVGKC
jgi:hypothetical protein